MASVLSRSCCRDFCNSAAFASAASFCLAAPSSSLARAAARACASSRARRCGLSRVVLLLRRFVEFWGLRVRGQVLASFPSKLAREGRGTGLCLFEGAALWLGSLRHSLRGLGFLHQGGGLLLLLLQGLSQFRAGVLRRLLLFRCRIGCLLRLRGLGLDLAAFPRKLAREGRGTGLCLFEGAALRFGSLRHRLRGLGF